MSIHNKYVKILHVENVLKLSFGSSCFTLYFIGVVYWNLLQVSEIDKTNHQIFL
jgi:hypothetical protein